MAATLITSKLIHSRYQSFILNRGSVNDRYASFDLCYSYFANNKGHLIGKDLESSCLQLWAFLGSWGMVARGNAMQGKSYAYLDKVIAFINSHPKYYSSVIDSPTYPEEMLELYKGLKNAINLSQKSQKTIITKIMLGVYGCIPAFDQYVCETYGTSTLGDLTYRNIQSIISTYTKHKVLIDKLASSTPVLSFGGSTSVGLTYSPAKIVDMVAFSRP